METNPNITRLLEMLDNPEAYSEQEIRDIINSDDETREAYRLMVTVRQGYHHKQPEQSTDAEAAWQRLENQWERMQEDTSKETNGQRFGTRSFIYKIAVSFIGVLLVSTIVLAAIHIVRRHLQPQEPQSLQTENRTSTVNTLPVDTLETDTANLRSVIYDNVPLEKMLPEIAAHYGTKVTFRNNESRQLRFHFVWNPQSGIDKVVGDLNHFERLHVTVKDQQLIVE